MRSSAGFLSPSEAADRLGVSIKALRVYEGRGLIRPTRTAAGWRAYGPETLALAAEIIGLRSLGFTLAQIEALPGETPDGLEIALAAHQARVEVDLARIAARLDRIRALRRSLASGESPAAGDLAGGTARQDPPLVGFDLPWPWGGERFELTDVRAINYIVGPLGSGKTQLAGTIARRLSNAAFVGLDRLQRVAEFHRALEADMATRSDVDAVLARLCGAGATASAALFALVASLRLDRSKALVIDLIEHGLDEPAQFALMIWMRERSGDAPPLFVMTRSSAILDLAALGPDETVIFCPANHSPPFRVGPGPAGRGYEAVETCLGSPQVRARTEGMVARMPLAAA